ncbi:adenosine deaminase [Thalassospira sp. MCCC 1A03138]|uniref:adenosine deaminase n=1 Tax=Thalassospira sp. MCCC 1A03138 TaxID=1470576 RepID=UPI000A1EE893|nr:adenosine deaminase [Thalassospira sp. MCCC 1A03138]OSQ30127.1 adenosine deaminase [Thalassospira sp. MCCC 1A03138]
MTQHIPKAELHLHMEGALTPALVRKFAARNGISLPDGIYDDQDRYIWSNFPEFLGSFDRASAAIRTGNDYADLTHWYLCEQAKAGALYVEIFCSPSHALECGISFDDHLNGVAEGIDRAGKETGIIGRIIMTCVRHIGPETAIGVAADTVACGHPYIVGFGMGGNESMFSQEAFYPAYKIAADAGLGCTTHAGEVEGPQSVWDAIDKLPVTRIGHGVRSIEDSKLVEELVKRGIVLEVCPGSNIALSVYPDYASHPLRRLYDAGVKVTLGSDDPPFFHTTLAEEYQRTKDVFGFSENELRGITRTALEAAFVDADTKAILIAKLDAN